MKIHVFQILQCALISNRDPSNIWTTNWMMCGTNTDLTKRNLAAQEGQFIWHVYPGAPNGRDPDTCDEKIMMLSMFNDIDWTKRQYRHLFAKEVATLAAKFMPGHW